MILFGCLFGMFAAFAPRLAFLFYWLARPAAVNAAFNTFIFPCLGLIFLPFTTLMWVLLYTPGIGITGLDWLWLGLAVVLDIGQLTTGGRYGWLNRRNVPGMGGSSTPVNYSSSTPSSAPPTTPSTTPPTTPTSTPPSTTK